MDKNTWEERQDKFQYRWFKYHGDNELEEDKSSKMLYKLVLNKFGELSDVDFKCKNVLEVGCGAYPYIHWAVNCNRYAIEPLKEKYLDLNPNYCNFIEVAGVPAEEHLTRFENKFDIVLLWNCLEYMFDWRKALDNVYSYMKNGGVFVFGFKHPDVNYEKVEMDAICTYIANKFDIKKIGIDFRKPYVLFKVVK